MPGLKEACVNPPRLFSVQVSASAVLEDSEAVFADMTLRPSRFSAGRSPAVPPGGHCGALSSARPDLGGLQLRQESAVSPPLPSGGGDMNE